jgi:hypothetical protein
MSYELEDNQIAQQSANASNKPCEKYVLLFGKDQQYCSGRRRGKCIGIKEPCQKSSEISQESQSIVKGRIRPVGKKDVRYHETQNKQ